MDVSPAIDAPRLYEQWLTDTQDCITFDPKFPRVARTGLLSKGHKNCSHSSDSALDTSVQAIAKFNQTVYGHADVRSVEGSAVVY